MREIKFRAFIDGEYYYSTDEKFNMFWEGGKLSITYVSGLLEGTDEVFETISEGFILEQFTGLKDKNGVEIYEGDMVAYSDVSGSGRPRVFEPREVIWHCDSCNFNVVKPGHDSTLEVIGNIHENPELLK